MHEFELLVG
jgi:hypothetical protein